VIPSLLKLLIRLSWILKTPQNTLPLYLLDFLKAQTPSNLSPLLPVLQKQHSPSTLVRPEVSLPSAISHFDSPSLLPGVSQSEDDDISLLESINLWLLLVLSRKPPSFTYVQGQRTNPHCHRAGLLFYLFFRKRLKCLGLVERYRSGTLPSQTRSSRKKKEFGEHAGCFYRLPHTGRKGP
jgi:hypothetical protein